jgi:hypothetical protein
MGKHRFTIDFEVKDNLEDYNESSKLHKQFIESMNKILSEYGSEVCKALYEDSYCVKYNDKLEKRQSFLVKNYPIN